MVIGNWQYICLLVDPALRFEIIFRKERTAESGVIDFEIDSGYKHLSTLVLVYKLMPLLAPLGRQNIIWIFSNLRLSTF